MQIPARALYNYSAQDGKQISLIAGQVIFIIHDGGPGGWSKGTFLNPFSNPIIFVSLFVLKGVDPSTGKSGFFPSDYVKKEMAVPLSGPQVGPYPMNQMLSLPQQTLAPAVRPGNVFGPLPSSGMPVAGIAAQPAQLTPPAVAALPAIALYDFPASKSSEQGLRKGETVLVLVKGAAGGWSKGERGIFPTDYIKFLEPAAVGHIQPVSQAAASGLSQSTQPSLLPLAGSVAPMKANNVTDDDGDNFGDFISVAPANETKPSSESAAISNSTAQAAPAFALDLLAAPAEVIAPVMKTPLSSKVDLAFTFDDEVVKPTMSPAPTLLNQEPLSLPEFQQKISSPTARRTEPVMGNSSANLIDSMFSFGEIEEPKTQIHTDSFVAKPQQNFYKDMESSSILDAAFKNNQKNSSVVSSSHDAFSFSDMTSTASMTSVSNAPMHSSANPFDFASLDQPEPSKLRQISSSPFSDQPSHGSSVSEGNTLLDMDSLFSSNVSPAATKTTTTSAIYSSPSNMPVTSLFLNENTGVGGGNSLSSGAPSRGSLTSDLLAVSDNSSNGVTGSSKVFVGSLHNRMSTRGGNETVLRNRDRQTFSLNEEGDEQKAGIWTQPFFHDLFTSVIIKRMERRLDQPPLTRMANAFHAVRMAINQVKGLSRRDNDISDVLSLVSSAFKEASDVCKDIPIDTNDHQKFTDFLASFMSRVKHLRQGEIVISPCVWSTSSTIVTTTNEDGTPLKKTVYDYHGVIVLIYRTAEGTEEDFSLTVVNTSKVNGGLDYHAVEVDNSDGALLYNLAFELVSIPATRIQNTAFW